MYTGLTDSLWRGAERKELSLTLNGTAVTGALLSLTITASVNGEQSLLTVGNTCAKTVQMQFSGVQTGFLEGSLALSAQAGAETLPLGTFAVTEAVTRGGQTTVTAVDAMGVALAELYQPSLTGSAATAWAVLNDVAAKAGVALSTRASGYQNVLSEVSMASLTAGYTHRTVVGWIAGLCGCNAVIDRAGKLDFIWYSASGMTLHRKECYEGMDEIQESDSVFSMLSVSVVDTNGNTQTLSPASAQGTGALIENPFMTQAQLNGVWSGIGGMTYRPAELSFLGDLRLDAGDLITLTLDDGTTCSVPVMSLTHTYDGGVTTHVTALGQGESAGAGVRNGGVLGGKLRSLSAEVAQLGALTVEDENGVTKINGGRIDTDTLFAQDITATGTITGAQLIGAILSGNAIDIQAVIDATSIGLKTELVDNSYCLVLSAAGGTTKSSITLSRGSLKLVGQSLLELDTQELVVNANSIQFAVAEGSYCPYYKAGDSVTITRMYCAGGVTGSGTNLYFYIPLAKPLIGVSNVTISNPTKAIITARKVEGGYIAQDATVSSLGTPSCVPYEGGVTIGIKASSAYNTKNNTPVTVTPENLVLKFT